MPLPPSNKLLLNFQYCQRCYYEVIAWARDSLIKFTFSLWQWMPYRYFPLWWEEYMEIKNRKKNRKPMVLQSSSQSSELLFILSNPIKPANFRKKTSKTQENRISDRKYELKTNQRSPYYSRPKFLFAPCYRLLTAFVTITGLVITHKTFNN